jgi:hypothetical protein
MAAITRSNISTIRADVEAALRTIYAKHGIDITVGRISYDAAGFRCKIDGIVRGSTGATAPVTPKVAALPGASWLLGNTFDQNKKYASPSLGTVMFTGYNSRARKYPFIVKQLRTGKSYKMSTIGAKQIVANGEAV